MKLKTFLLVSAVIIVAACNIYPQTSPSYFMLGKTAGLNKLTAGTPYGNSITDIITTGDTIWLGTGRGVSQSTDKGLSWKNYYNTDPFGQEDISAIAYRDGLFMAATAHSVEASGSVHSSGSGLRYTTNNGASWLSIAQPQDSLRDTFVVYGINRIRALPVTTSIDFVNYDVTLTKDAVWIATFAGGLRKTTDFGNSWQRVVLPPDYLNSIKPTDTLSFSLQPVAGNFGKESNLNHRVFSVVAANDSLIYVGTANGINKSTDGGNSWRKFNHQNQPKPISGNFVVAMAYNNSNNTIWAATWKAEDIKESYGVSYSTDGGETWSVALEGEKVHNFGFKGNEVIALSDNGAFRSNDLGSTWIKPTAIFDSETKIPLISAPFYSAALLGNDVWLGSEKGLARITETPGVMWSGTWKVYFASQPLASSTEAYAFPNPFSPDVEPVSIKYSTGGARESVTIRIFDFGMNLIKTVIQNAERGNSFHTVEGNNSPNSGVIDNWDGRDEYGRLVPNGVYFFRIDIGSNNPVFGKIMVLM